MGERRGAAPEGGAAEGAQARGNGAGGGGPSKTPRMLIEKNSFFGRGRGRKRGAVRSEDKKPPRRVRAFFRWPGASGGRGTGEPLPKNPGPTKKGFRKPGKGGGPGGWDPVGGGAATIWEGGGRGGGPALLGCGGQGGPSAGVLLWGFFGGGALTSSGRGQGLMGPPGGRVWLDQNFIFCRVPPGFLPGPQPGFAGPARAIQAGFLFFSGGPKQQKTGLVNFSTHTKKTEGGGGGGGGPRDGGGGRGGARAVFSFGIRRFCTGRNGGGSGRHGGGGGGGGGGHGKIRQIPFVGGWARGPQGKDRRETEAGERGN